jgi:methionyl aminopeptidase
MIKTKTAEEIEILRENAILVSKTLAVVGRHCLPGVTTKELDSIAEEYIRDHGAIPGFLGYGGFPYTLCISVNDTIVHGFPSEYVMKEGDIVSVDCGTVYKGFYGDSAYTFPVGEINSTDKRLLATTKKSLELGIAAALPGGRVGDIGNAVQTYCENAGFSVVREMVGHGLGRDMHESPEVPNYGRKGTGVKLMPGMVICIEPMINEGKRDVYLDDNGWSVKTEDGSNAAHYEKTIAISAKGEPDVLTTYKYIEEPDKYKAED